LDAKEEIHAKQEGGTPCHQEKKPPFGERKKGGGIEGGKRGLPFWKLRLLNRKGRPAPSPETKKKK